ncbi:MAG: pilin [Patescibacteria group bacterium]|jgi:hypothetical protein
MKKRNKILLASLILTIFLPVLVLAAGETTPPKMQVIIGSTKIDFQTVSCTAGSECSIPWLGQYISALYNYGVGFAAALAIVMIMVGGLVWLMSAGSPDKVGKAKEFITSALSGLFLALFAIMVLTAINPKLTNLEAIRIKQIAVAKLPGVISPGFGSGGSAEFAAIGAGTGAGGGTARGNFTQLTDEANQRRQLYQDQGCTSTDGYRAGENRHGSGYVWDASMTAPCYNYVTTNAIKNPDGSNFTQLTWGRAYRMRDGTIFVDEPGGTGRHFHVEAAGANWTWVPEWPR